MSEFKGTNGPWYLVKGDVNHIGECLSIANTPESHFQRPLICLVSNITSVNDSDKANALLISKAPEMLAVLEAVANMHPDANPINLIKAARQIIKSATEI